MKKIPNIKGHVLIDGKVYPVDKIFQVLQRGGIDIGIEKGDLILEAFSKPLERIQPKFRSLQEQAMAITCFGSLAYCCPLDKKCLERDKALEHLGLNREDFQILKQELHEKIVKYAKNRKTESRDYTYLKSDLRYPENDLRPFEEVKKDDSLFEDDYLQEFSLNKGLSPREKKIEENLFANGKSSHGELLDLLGEPHEKGSETEDTNFCVNCGSRLPSNAKFCSRCGVKM